MGNLDLSVNIAGMELENPFIIAASDNTRHIKQIKKAVEFGASAVVIKAVLPSTSKELDSMLRVFVDPKSKIIYGTGGANRLNYEQGIDLVKVSKKETKIKIGVNVPLILDEYDDVIVDGIKRLAKAGADFIELNYKPFIFSRPAIAYLNKQKCFNIREITEKYENYISYLMKFIPIKTRIIREAVDIPLIAKITPDGVDELALATAAIDGGIDAIDAISSFGGAYNIDIFDDGRPKIPNSTKCFFQVNGAVLKPFSLAIVARLSKSLNVPIIGTGGLMKWGDVVEMIMFGAHAVSFCAILMIDGFEILTEIQRGLVDFMDKKGYKNLTDFRGSALKYVASSMSTCIFTRCTAKIDLDKCIGCGLCLKPAHCVALQMEENKAIVDESECLGCGTCLLLCPVDAVTMVEI